MILPGFPVISKGSVPVGAWVSNSAMSGDHSLVIPLGVESVCILCVAPGGSGGGDSGGGGGALSYTNGIAVTEGQTLNIHIGLTAFHGGSGYDDTYVARGGTTLVRAQAGRYATPTASPGFWNSGIGGQAGSGIGAVRYSGQDASGGIAGSAVMPDGTVRTPAADFGGYGCELRESDWSEVAAAGSTGSKRNGAWAGGGGCADPDGLTKRSGGKGGVVIIWGPGRAFSSASTY